MKLLIVATCLLVVAQAVVIKDCGEFTKKKSVFFQIKSQFRRNKIFCFSF